MGRRKEQIEMRGEDVERGGVKERLEKRERERETEADIQADRRTDK